MQAARRLIDAIRAGGPRAWALAAAAVALLLAYSSLFTLGTRYGFEKGVEYWLFRPTDNAPLVIVALSLWLFYRRAYRVRGLPRSTASLALLVPCVTLAVGFHAWAVYTRADDLKVVSLVAVVAALVLSRWGVRGLRALWLPIVFLLFAIPIPAPLLLAIVFKLQIWTAHFAGSLLYLLGVPALVSGDQIVRATQTFQVIEGCSGMRSIETLSMLTILLIDLFGRRGWHAAVLIILAPLVAFSLNGVRVLTLILNPHSEIIAIHNLQGIAILLIGLLVVYGVDALIERRFGEDDAWSEPRSEASRPYVRGIAVAVFAVLAVAVPASALLTPHWVESTAYPYSLYSIVSDELEAWPSEKIEPDFAFRGSARFAQVVHRAYALDDAPVRIFVATADLGQRGGSPLSPITALPGTGWMVRESVATELDEDGRRVEERVVERGKQRVLVQHWFVGDRGLAVETLRSLLALDRSPLRRSETLYVARLETPILGRDAHAFAAAKARLAATYRALGPALRRLEADASAPSPALTSIHGEL